MPVVCRKKIDSLKETLKDYNGRMAYWPTDIHKFVEFNKNVNFISSQLDDIIFAGNFLNNFS